MKPWSYLVESYDEKARRRQRAAAATGGKEDVAAYMAELRRQGVPNEMRWMVGYPNRTEWLLPRLGIPRTNIPPDLEVTAKIEGPHTGYEYTFNVVKSGGGRSGAGSRVKLVCPMCGKTVAATPSQVNQHVRQTSHSGIPAHQKMRPGPKLASLVRKFLNKVFGKKDVHLVSYTNRQIGVVVHKSIRDKMVKAVESEFRLRVRRSDAFDDPIPDLIIVEFVRDR